MFVGGKVEKGENVFFPSHSIGHQALDLPSPPFSFSLKGRLGSWGVSLSPDIIFNSILNTCFNKLLEEEKND
jgi:hypothetical protein